MNADTILNLKTGTYELEVTNSAGYCSVVNETFDVTEPVAIEGNPIVTNITCYGLKNGKINFCCVLIC